MRKTIEAFMPSLGKADFLRKTSSAKKTRILNDLLQYLRRMISMVRTLKQLSITEGLDEDDFQEVLEIKEEIDRLIEQYVE